MIRQITPEDFKAFYQIWEEGSKDSFNNPSLDVKSQHDYYRSYFLQQITMQDDTFKIWGYFDGDNLLGWMSVFPCHPSPLLRQHSGEISCYVAASAQQQDIGFKLGEHLLSYAQKHTALYLVQALISPQNLAIINLAKKLGFATSGRLPASANGKIPQFDLWTYALK